MMERTTFSREQGEPIMRLFFLSGAGSPRASDLFGLVGKRCQLASQVATPPLMTLIDTCFLGQFVHLAVNAFLRSDPRF